MLPELRPEAVDLISRVKDFIEKECVPVEHTFHEQIQDGDERRSFAKAHNLPFVEIPAKIPSMEYFLIWHKSDEGDGGHIWMKELIISAFVDAKK